MFPYDRAGRPQALTKRWRRLFSWFFLRGKFDRFGCSSGEIGGKEIVFLYFEKVVQAPTKPVFRPAWKIEKLYSPIERVGYNPVGRPAGHDALHHGTRLECTA